MILRADLDVLNNFQYLFSGLLVKSRIKKRSTCGKSRADCAGKFIFGGKKRFPVFCT